MRKTLTVFFLVFVAISSANCDEEKVDKGIPSARISEAETLFQRINDSNNGLRDYTTNLNIILRTLGIGLNLKAELLYKEPEKIKLVLKNVPDFLSRHKHIFTTKTITGSMRRGFNCQVTGSKILDGESCWLLEMIPKREGSILSIHLWVRRKDLGVPKILYRYREGGVITLKQEFRTYKGFLLLDHQYADIRFPKIQGSIEAMYQDYKINTGLSDQIFEGS